MNTWEKSDYIFKWFAIILIPITLGIFTYLADQHLSEKKSEQELLTLSINILMKEPSNMQPKSLRESAVAYLVKSGFLIDEKGKEELYKNSLNKSIDHYKHWNNSFLWDVLSTLTDLSETNLDNKQKRTVDRLILNISTFIEDYSNYTIDTNIEAFIIKEAKK